MNSTNVNLTAQSSVTDKVSTKFKLLGYTLGELAVLGVLFVTAIACYVGLYEMIQSVFK